MRDSRKDGFRKRKMVTIKSKTILASIEHKREEVTHSTEMNKVINVQLINEFQGVYNLPSYYQLFPYLSERMFIYLNENESTFCCCNSYRDYEVHIVNTIISFKEYTAYPDLKCVFHVHKLSYIRARPWEFVYFSRRFPKHRAVQLVNHFDEPLSSIAEFEIFRYFISHYNHYYNKLTSHFVQDSSVHSCTDEEYTDKYYLYHHLYDSFHQLMYPFVPRHLFQYVNQYFRSDPIRFGFKEWRPSNILRYVDDDNGDYFFGLNPRERMALHWGNYYESHIVSKFFDMVSAPSIKKEMFQAVSNVLHIPANVGAASANLASVSETLRNGVDQISQFTTGIQEGYQAADRRRFVQREQARRQPVVAPNIPSRSREEFGYANATGFNAGAYIAPIINDAIHFTNEYLLYYKRVVSDVFFNLAYNAQMTYHRVSEHLAAGTHISSTYFANEVIEVIQDWSYFPTSLFITRTFRRVLGYIGVDLPTVNYVMGLVSMMYEAGKVISALSHLGGDSIPRIHKESDTHLGDLIGFVKNLLKPLKQLAGAIKDVTTLIVFVKKIFEYVKEIINWIYPGGVEVSPNMQKLLTKFLAIVEFYKAEDNAYLLGLLNHRLVLMELRDGPDSVLRQLEKFFSDLERRNPNNQSFALFMKAHAEYEKLYTKCVYNGGRGDATARIEPTVIALFGGVEIGKSTLLNYLVSVVVETLGPNLDLNKSEATTYNLNLANKHMDGYKGQPVCIIDDIFTTHQSSACSGAGMYNSMVSNTDFVVPQADLPDKGRKFSSKVILTTSNLSHPTGLPDVSHLPAIWRRRDLLVECRRRTEHGAPVPFPVIDPASPVLTSANFGHLQFRLIDPMRDNIPLTNWMNMEEFTVRVKEKLLDKFEKQTTLVKLLQATVRSKQPDVQSKEEILKEILRENPDHFWYDGISVMCKDALCNCLCLYEDARRYVSSQYPDIVGEGIVNSILTTLSEGATSFIGMVTEFSPGAKYLAAAGLALVGLAAGVALYRKNGNPEKIAKEMREEIPDWRKKNAEHFKNKPANVDKTQWRQILVSQEIANLMDRTNTHWTVDVCNGNQLILSSSEPIVNEIRIRSDVSGLVGATTINSNPYKLTNTPESIRVPLEKNLKFESQNSNEAIRIIQKHTYLLRRPAGTVHATHVMGQCLLTTYHWFDGMERGDTFEMIPCYQGAARTLVFEPRHLLRLADGDVCVYWIAGDFCTLSVLNQFIPVKDLAKITHVRNMGCFSYTKENEFGGWGYHTFTNASLAEYVDIHTDDGQFREAKAMSFASSEAPGRCGALYVGTDKFNPSVLGFHVGHHGGLGYLRLITREEVSEMVKALHKRIGMPLFRAPPPPPIIKECEGGVAIGANMPFVGIMDPKFCKYQKKDHSKIPSPAYNLIYEPTKDQSVLSSRDRRIKPEFRTTSVLKKGLEKYSVPYREMPWALMKSFEEYHLMRFKKFRVAERPRVRSYDEVINGVRDESGAILNYMTGINMKSSAGFGWSAPPASADGGKSYLFDKTLMDWGYYYTMKEELVKAVQELEKAFKDGIIPHLITTNCLKDELRPLQKIFEANSRNFVMFPVEWTIFTKSFFMDWTAAMTATHGDSSAQVGIDPTGRDWHDMIVAMLKYSKDHGFDGDYKAYDGAVFYQQLIPIIDAINRWYDDGDENAMIRHGLAVRMIFSYILSENEVHYKNQGQTSGNVLTSPLNCEINAQLFGYAWLMSWFEECRKDPTLEPTRYNLNNMHQYVISKFYGDDNIHAVKKEVVDWFYPERIAKWINSTGFQITDAEKTGELRWKKVEELSFLKMKTRKHNGFYIGKLDETSIKEMVNWIRDNTYETPDEKLRTNMDTMLKFAFAYGKDYYDEMLETLNTWLNLNGHDMLTTTYRDRNLNFLDKKMGVKFGQWEGDIPSIFAYEYNEEDHSCPLPGGPSGAESDYLSVTSGTLTTCLNGEQE